jgi:hypothetical protein
VPFRKIRVLLFICVHPRKSVVDLKKKSARGRQCTGGRDESGQLNFLLFLRGERGLGGLGLGGALLELVHATGGVHEFLLAGVKRMADVADADDDDRLGGTRLDHVAAGATDFRVHIFWMNVRLHKKDGKLIRKTGDDKREFWLKTDQPQQGGEG